jgi:hypothetical protein
MGNGKEEKMTTIGTVKGNTIKKWKLQGLIDLSGVMYLKNGRQPVKCHQDNEFWLETGR